MTPGASSPSSNSGGPIPHGRNYVFVVVFGFLLQLLLSVCGTWAASGCSDGSREGLETFESAAACAGSWAGHVDNASFLCAPGWRVCTWLDVNVLRNITWENAMTVEGCMAINAAHDGGRCRQCRDDLEQDDMGGVGRECSHQAHGQSSCISGGRMDASCCVDSHFHKACHFQPGRMTGVVCCRLPVRKPHIVVKPAERLRVYKGLIFLLTCQASGMPPPRIHWYKDGRRFNRGGSSRITALPTGDLLVTLARKSDSGLYTCEAINEQGIDMASSYVSVTEHSSGCADGTTDGLNMHRDIHACTGVWKGHVRHGKSLCAKGWRVCSPRNRDKLRDLSSFEMFDLSGCYAYNAASRQNRCKRCKNGKMAGLGRHCGWVNYSHSSCLAKGRMDVFAPNATSSCNYTPGLTTGVLCCKKPRRRKDKSTCKPVCQNKGICLPYNRCKCAVGYKGARCQIPICKPDCGSKGVCIRPNKCKCKPNYYGRSCRNKTSRCKTACLNGGRCYRGQCKCAKTFWGKACQYPLQHVLLSRMNRTER